VDNAKWSAGGHWLAVGAAFAIVLGYVCGLALGAAVPALIRTTAIFASVPGGARRWPWLGDSVSATRFDRVASAQSLRICDWSSRYRPRPLTRPSICTGRIFYVARLRWWFDIPRGSLPC
jgi:hypothetical protein